MRIRELEGKVKRKKAAAEAADKAISEAQAVLEAAQVAVTAAREEADRHRKELTELEADLAKFRQQQLVEASIAGKETPGEKELSFLESVLGSGVETTALLGPVLAAVRKTSPTCQRLR